MKKSITVITACTNANGSADMCAHIVEVTESEYDLGIHYDKAQELAEADGYEGPFVSFDNSEHTHIANIVPKLRSPIPFSCENAGDLAEGVLAETLEGNITFHETGINFNFDGHTDCTSVDDKGVVFFLEQYSNSAYITCYADINSEEPTHRINFDGARNSKRIDS